jgi:SAM-dependent methyltransferase
MKPALSFQAQKLPDSWADFPHGELILTQVNERLEPWWSKIFGYHLLKLGPLSCQVDTSNSPISHQINVASSGDNLSVVADIDDLPFIQHAVDAVLLSHVLEFVTDPHHVLREAHRVLIPGGYLVLTGFNPLSLAGINKLVHFKNQQFPWNGRFFTTARVRDWLQLLGFEICDEQRFLFSSLSTYQGLAERMFIQRFCQRYCSTFGSSYVIVAKKRVQPLTPIRPRWSPRLRFRPAIKGATLQPPQ